MHARSSVVATAALIALLGLTAAGCGSGDSSSSSTTAASSTTAPTSAGGSGGAATIDLADNPDLGQILTDADGNTVYLFEKDEDGTSNCSGECATEWPPVTTSGSAKAGDGADQSLISTIKRDDGSMQVTYDGHPLYLYAGDTKPGDTSGNELELYGAEWYAITPDGSNAEGSADSGSGDSSEGSTSGGYSTY